AQVHFVRGGKSKRFEILKGEVDAVVPPQAGEPLLVTTLHAELRVREAEFRLLDAADFTRLEVRKGSADFTRRSDGRRIDAGSLSADVTKQPDGRPMILSTAHADARVLGTRFTLAVEAGQTRLQVEEGAVQFTQSRERESIVVRSGYCAIAAPGRPFEAVPV